MIKRLITQISLFFALIFFIWGCAEPSLVQKTYACLGTIVEISVAQTDKDKLGIVSGTINKAFARIKATEELFSKFDPQSEISQINSRAFIHPVRVNAETVYLLEQAIQFSRLTGGAFDVTVGPLIELWGLGLSDEHRKDLSSPNPRQLEEVLKRVGYQNIRINKKSQTVSLACQGMVLDLGGIAKGYAVDQACAVLQEQGINNALVNAGGDIYALGRRSREKRWRIGIQHPRKKGAILTTLELEDQAVATSGDYQRYLEIVGKRYSHIINPQTGYPCVDSPVSVTVLAESCFDADALATAIFVLGPEKGIDLINQFEDSEAIVVNLQQDKLSILLSQGLKGKLKFQL